MRAEPYVEDRFLVVGADTVVGELPLERMSVNSFLVTRVEDPRPYGVVVVREETVVELEEKPVNPKSNVVVVPYYEFDREVFRALRRVEPEDELQLTDAIRLLLREGVQFRAVEVGKVYDLGNMEGYLDYLRKSLK